MQGTEKTTPSQMELMLGLQEFLKACMIKYPDLTETDICAGLGRLTGFVLSVNPPARREVLRQLVIDNMRHGSLDALRLRTANENQAVKS